MNNLVIIGASGHGKVIADIAEMVGYTDIVFLDDNAAVKSCGEYAVAGGCNKILAYKNSDFVVAIGNAKIRRIILTKLAEEGLHIVSLIHPAAVIAPSVKIGSGTVVMAGAVVNPYAEIGQGCIINTCASVDHDCLLGNFVHISVGAHIAGTVTIRDNTWVGAGAVIINDIEVIEDCTVGAGAVVIADIKEPGVYVGVPAKKIKSNALETC
jgi:sugar O-acyltransferase (sialic acid O-acetyltransferase NeuD family)